MRLGAVVPVRNEWRFLPAVLGQLLRVVDRCAILRSRRSFSGAPAALAALPAIDPRVEVIEGDWENAHVTRNAGLSALSDCEYVFTLDSDEIFFTEDLEYLAGLCRRGRHRAIGTRLHTYWKTVDYQINPPELLVAPMVVRRDAWFVHDRRVPDGIMELSRPWCQHLSYVRTDEEVQEKLRLFPHAEEVLPGWFDRVWKGWDEDRNMKNLHPTHPPNYGRAILMPAPALRRLLESYGCDGGPIT